MAVEVPRDPDLEWLDHVQPVGLVIAPSVLKEMGLTPLHQSPIDTGVVAELLNPDKDGPALTDPWPFVEAVLGWEARHVAGAPGGPELPDALAVRLRDHDTTLVPTWAVAELGESGQPWQLLVRVEAVGIDPDGRGQLEGWEASPHQRFERLLRDTGVFAGLLITDREMRLVYAPRGETSGYLSFPLRPLGLVAGRPMLGGLKLLLDSFRLFSDADDRRLPALLKASRDAQASVSTELAGQVLGALHELLRGLDAADADLIRELARSRPGHLYDGLLTVLMRLVFILYAEDRDLLPSGTDARTRAIYETSYSLRSLYARLVEDAALNPDTMEERRGGWGQLLALFRLIHKGHRSGFMQARGGKLFDSDEFPFLEGRRTEDDRSRILNVSDGCILRILEGLMTLKLRGRERERLSYRALDVEQIGSVYETVMGFTVEAAKSRVLAIKAGKNNRTPVFVALDELLARKGKDRIKDLKENVGRSLTAAQAKPVEAAATVEELAATLDGMVDERGSPRHVVAPAGTPILQPTGERRRTGSHYTPRSLTQPIVAHALEPAFERLGPDATPDQILDLKVCDPAMGSGAFLVEACRAIASRLVAAWAKPGPRPVIPADEDEDLHARRLVAQRCLYGVDKNPRAVDLAKLSLWLATLAKDHEFTFLDHALKCGDSLVGLDAAQIAAMHWDTSKPGLPLFRQFVADRVTEATKARAEIRSAPDDTMRVILEQKHRFVENRIEHVRVLGDAVLSAFFAEDKPKAREKRRVTIESWVASIDSVKWDELTTAADGLRRGEHPLLPFHWAIEFPEVFGRGNPGFDTIIGNPPFLGGMKLSPSLGNNYLSFLYYATPSAGSRCDLVAYFLRRAFTLLRDEGRFGLICTNTIAQGDTRIGGLEWLVKNGAVIYSAVRRFPWPGEAAVVVSIIHIAKTAAVVPAFLDGRPVNKITAFLFHAGGDTSPVRLSENIGKCFVGNNILGMGFTFDDASSAGTPLEIMRNIIEKNPECRPFIFPFIGGDEVATHPTQQHHRYVINFGDMELKDARKYAPLLEIVEEKVLPERQKKKGAYATRWWLFGRRNVAGQMALRKVDRALVSCQVSPHISWVFLKSNMIFAHTLSIVPSDTYSAFSVLQSRPHELWARFFASSMKDDLRYTPSDCFETFPFPEGFGTSPAFEAAGQIYYDHRAALMVAHNEGVTKTYNRFHDRTEAAADIVRLRELHADMDRGVLEAYGWQDLAERAEAIFLDDTNEDDHAYQGRLFWPSDVRDEVLARLLELNAERHAEEIQMGTAPRLNGRARNADEDEEEGDLDV